MWRAAVLVTALSFAACSSDGGVLTRGTAEVPSSVAMSADDSLPPLSVSPAELTAWLDGEGVVFGPVRSIGAAFLAASPPTTADCAQWTDELSAGPSPDALLVAAATSPDAVLGDALGSASIALNRVLSACGAGGTVAAESADDLRAQLALVDERVGPL